MAMVRVRVGDAVIRIAMGRKVGNHRKGGILGNTNPIS